MAAINLKSLSHEEMNSFFDSFDTVLSDCDGVLWLDMEPLPHSSTVMNTFCEVGKQIFYVTNNSTKTRSEFSEKCKVLNFKATEDNILCTAHLAANYLHDMHFNKKVFIVGSTGISKELDRVGIKHVGVGPDIFNPAIPRSFDRDPDIGAVVVGFDEHLSFPKIIKAATYLGDRSVHFIATNTDEQFPTSENYIIPGTGSMVRCIETCANRKATVMGKPESYVANMLKNKFNVNPKHTLMIGDRANSDILLGTRCGFKTLLVLSGVTTIEEVENWKLSNNEEERKLVPDYYIEKLGDLLPYLLKYKANKIN